MTVILLTAIALRLRHRHWHLERVHQPSLICEAIPSAANDGASAVSVIVVLSAAAAAAAVLLIVVHVNSRTSGFAGGEVVVIWPVDSVPLTMVMFFAMDVKLCRGVL